DHVRPVGDARTQAQRHPGRLPLRDAVHHAVEPEAPRRGRRVGAVRESQRRRRRQGRRSRSAVELIRAPIDTRWMRLAIGCVLLSSSVAFADDQPQPNLTVGLGAQIMKVFSTSGGVGMTKASDQGTAYGFDLYAEYRISTHFSLGLAIPMTFNGPGPTTNEYD